MIQQYFDSQLLCMPMIKFIDDSQTLYEFYSSILALIYKKSRSGKWNINKKQENLINEFKYKYESIKIKEKELEEKNEGKIKMPLYFITCSDKNVRYIYKRFRKRKDVLSGNVSFTFYEI
jgi:hypothetical protein